MMRNQRRLALATMLALGGCAGADDHQPLSLGLGIDVDNDESEESSGGEELLDVDEYILDIEHFPVDAFVPKTQTDCEGGDCPVNGQEGEQFCTYTSFTETAHFNELIAFEPGSVALWPGSLVQGHDAVNGVLSPITLPRAPLTLSISLENLDGVPVGELEDPKLSEFRSVRNELLAAGTTGPTPAQMALDIQRVWNESQVATSVGVSVGYGGAKISTLFEFGNHQQQTKMLVDFTQAYYTIDVDPPGVPSDLFTDEVDVEQLEETMGEGNPPMYVQSVTYGRRVIFAFESSESEKSVRAALDASFNALLYSGAVAVDVEHRQVIENSRLHAVILGGSGESAIKAVSGFDGLVEFLVEGADYSSQSPGAPIAYKLSYLDNSATTMAFTTEYAERQCFDTHANVTVELTKIENVGAFENDGAMEVYGTVQARLAAADDPDPCNPDAPDWLTLFDRKSNESLDVYGTWIPPVPPTQTVYDFEVDPQAQLCFRGDLSEKDSGLFSSDDDLGDVQVGPIKLEHGWTGEHVLQFIGDGGDCNVTMNVTLE